MDVLKIRFKQPAESTFVFVLIQARWIMEAGRRRLKETTGWLQWGLMCWRVVGIWSAVVVGQVLRPHAGRVLWSKPEKTHQFDSN